MKAYQKQKIAVETLKNLITQDSPSQSYTFRNIYEIDTVKQWQQESKLEPNHSELTENTKELAKALISVMQQAEAKGINITWERQQRIERQQPQSAANATSPQPNLSLLTKYRSFETTVSQTPALTGYER